MKEAPQGSDPWREDSSWGPSNYSPADAAGDLATYRKLKRSISARSSLLLGVVAAILAFRTPLGAFSLAIGGLCGLANMWLAMHGNERLVEHRSVGAFVFSSFLRVGVFAIVPVGLALHGPWWTMALYFIGFFTPLALYMVSVRPAFRRD
ncbi:MAG: hypothetical protein NVS9B12_03990 [Vulcanimicrobiaceae bacterium]